MPYRSRDLDMRTLVGNRASECLQKGDPTHGWEGDPFLMLTHSNANGWEVFDRSNPDEFYRVWQSETLDKDELIRHIVERDSRRGFDPYEYMTKANEKLRKDKDAKATERIREDVAPRLAWALKKDGLKI